MRLLRRGLAVFLAAMLAVQTLPVMATEAVSPNNVQNKDETVLEDGVPGTTGTEDDVQDEESTVTGDNVQGEESKVTGDDVQGEGPTVAEDDVQDEELTDIEDDVQDEELTDIEDDVQDEEETDPESDGQDLIDGVFYNTGNSWIEVFDLEEGQEPNGEDLYFHKDGSFTIQIPEENPFFPYEVMFSDGDEETREWFMTPDSTVEFAGHKFSVDAVFKGDTAITQMSLNVGGKTVIVYPEEKDFSGASAYSLLPLPEGATLKADVSGNTPIDLTRVSIDKICAGGKALTDTDKVAWTRSSGSDDYRINKKGDLIDVSQSTTSSTKNLEIIIGDANQLNMSNTRYQVELTITDSDHWLTPTVYKQDAAGTRTQVTNVTTDYNDYNAENRSFYLRLPSDQIGNGDEKYVSFDVNGSDYPDYDSSRIKVYEGKIDSDDKISTAKDITGSIFKNKSMGSKDSGYKLDWNNPFITMVNYDAGGKVIGRLPIRLSWWSERTEDYVSVSLYKKIDNGGTEWTDYTYYKTILSDGGEKYTLPLYQEYPADQKYFLYMSYSQSGSSANNKVTAAFEGNYNTIAEAINAGQDNIWPKLTNTSQGYEGNYSGEGVTFSLFIGEDGAGQIKKRCVVVAEAGTRSKLDSSADAVFYGLKDGSGADIAGAKYYRVNTDEDSYAEFNYLTFLVDETVDVTSIAPTFPEHTYKVYAGRGTTQQVRSGANPQDFSKGPVQYTVASQNGENQKNYWIQVVKQTAGTDNKQNLYINSLGDPDAKTSADRTSSTREMMIDSYHGNVHDILLINTSKNAIPNLKAELNSTTVTMDDYWKLDGTQPLLGLTKFDKDYISTPNGELQNLAKIRLRKKDGVADGTDISGTLTIKSGNDTLMVLNLTGTLGDPAITTKEVPEAVKYVPYGSMIQNNNKYSWNRVKYALVEGSLPSGMVLKENGELYGVPKEAGTFTFTVVMSNSHNSFYDSVKEFTLNVLENTDENVENATDYGYQLSERIGNVPVDAVGTQVITSAGELGEFQDIYLDGSKLAEGTDYEKENGSTKITIQAQTLRSVGVGTHTLGMEFRKASENSSAKVDDRELKRAAQNFTVGGKRGGGSGGSGGSGAAVKVEKEIVSAKEGGTVTLKGVQSLTNSEMKALLKRKDVTLVMEYTYKGKEYIVRIPAGEAIDDDIPVYGPLYLAGRFGNEADPAWKAAKAAAEAAALAAAQAAETEKAALEAAALAAAEAARAAEEAAKQAALDALAAEQTAPAVHTVQAGDTMSKIAKANNMTLAELAAKNPQIKNLNRIKVGQKINL